MATFISKSPVETRQLGEAWGRQAQAGWVVGLTGDLGAGKTELVKGIARGLGVVDRVHSPTYSLIHEYNSGRLSLLHLDLFRLDTREQIVRAGVEAYFVRPNGVAVIEWAERWFGETEGSGWRVSSSMAGYRHVRMEVISETERRIRYEDFGV